MNQTLIKTLTDANLLEGKLPSETELDSPWYVKIILAFSGWLAAIFTLGFFGALFSSLYKDISVALVIGIVLITAAYFLLRKSRNAFSENLALALSLAGQALCLVAMISYTQGYTTSDQWSVIWLLVAVIQLPLVVFMPSYVHRVFSAFIAAVSLAVALFLYQQSFALPTFYSALLMLATALIWLNEFSFPRHIEKLQAVGYGLVFALILLNTTKVFMPHGLLRHSYLSNHTGAWFQAWIGEFLFTAVTLYVVWILLGRSHPKPNIKAVCLALGGIVLLSAISMQAHGLMTGVMILLLGFSASNRVLIGLGVISLLFFISHYYYWLGDSLMDKSITLLILGVLLLLARWLLLTLLPTKTQEAAS